MRRLKLSVASATLRVGIALGLVVVFLAAAAVCILQGTFATTKSSSVTAQKGTLDLSEDILSDGIVLLNGEWEYYPNVFETSKSFNPRLLERTKTQVAVFPISDVKQAVGPATYRLIISTDVPISEYAFYMEHYNEDFAIYVNGEKVEPTAVRQNEQLLYTLSNFLFCIDRGVEAGTVEIIISTNSSNDQALLYRNKIIFGETDEVVDHVARVWRDNTFLIGIIIVVVAIGLVFVLMRARFDILTTIAVFDTLLAIRILLGYSIATYFISNIFPGLKLDTVDFVRLQYTAFFFTGVFGCVLSQRIFDSKKELATWPIKAQMLICLAGGIFTLFFFRKLPEACVLLLLCVLVISFLIVTWHVIVLIKKKRLSGYYIFQIIKTYYVGGVMIFDIAFPQEISYNAFVYAYVIFLFADLAARIIDSNASYQEVEKLNSNLEQMIAERTVELTETNKSLSELSIRDPLTQAHNRLYFAQVMEEILGRQPVPLLYLCMFDLDHFKSINDRFGHIAGDDQLKVLVKKVNKILHKRGTLFRIGGEEFAILFEDESKSTVLSLIERIRRELEADANANEKRTTASFGLVRYKEGNTNKEIMQAADRCLYSAKKMGRNCIVVG